MRNVLLQSWEIIEIYFRKIHAYFRPKAVGFSRTEEVRLRMKNALKVIASLPMLWATTAFATSACKADACIDAAAASSIAPYDVLGAKCSAINPRLSAQYSAVVAYLLRDEDVATLQKLRDSSIYARVRAEF